MGLPATTSTSPTRTRAAALMLAIGTGRASSVLQHLDPDDVRALADEVAALEGLDARSRATLMRGALSHMLSIDPGAEAQLLRDRARSLEMDRGGTPINPGRPFEFLQKVEYAQVIQFLASEHPQTVAVILAARPPEFAAKVLTAFDEHVAGDIAVRIAGIGRTPPEAIIHIERELRRRLTEAPPVEDETFDGEKELATILNQGNRNFETSILEFVAKSDPEMAERIRALMFVFEDITILDDRSVQQVLQNVNTATLAVALKGVDDSVRDVIFRNLSERAKESLTEEIDLLGAVRKQDVTDARTAVVAQIRALEEAGTITINRGQDGDFVE